MNNEKLITALESCFAEKIIKLKHENNEVTIILNAKDLLAVCLHLRDDEQFNFEMLLDVCGVDYLDYNVSQWETDSSTSTGFGRGVDIDPSRHMLSQQGKQFLHRFAVVYHLLSIKHNHRLRIRVYCEDEPPIVDSVTSIWNSANWFEREAFDLYGILFKGHPDLRRILTDYGFIGHPFRKDFPLIGTVEMRYDKTKGRVVYEPVSIEPRTLVPKVIRKDNRYLEPNE